MSWSANNTTLPAPDIGSRVAVPLETHTAVPSVSPPSASQTYEQRQDPVASTIPDSGRERVTVPSACVQCRSKHLKCDGLTPCTRCSANSFDCLYVKSRRGFKGPRRNGVQSKAVSTPAAPVAIISPPSCPLVHPGGRSSTVRTSPTVSNNMTASDNQLQVRQVNVDLPQFDIGEELVSFESKASSAGMDLRERCIEAFFYHFCPAHPFILPRTNFMALRKERSMACLEAAMRYVGSFYEERAPTIELGLEAESLAYHIDTPKDGFKVQALLVLAIGLDGYTYQEKALQILIDAQDLALELGMNKRDFASLNGNGSSVTEESWRRTWWELYVIDGMIAGVHQKSSFRLNEVHADVALPCEEKEYVTGVSPVFLNRMFSADICSKYRGPILWRTLAKNLSWEQISTIPRSPTALQPSAILEESLRRQLDRSLLQTTLPLIDLMPTSSIGSFISQNRRRMQSPMTDSWTRCYSKLTWSPKRE